MLPDAQSPALSYSFSRIFCPTPLLSKSFSHQHSQVFLAALLGNMLTPPSGTEAGIQLPCILNLNSRKAKDERTFVQEANMRKELRALFVMVLLAAPYMGIPYSATAQLQQN